MTRLIEASAVAVFLVAAPPAVAQTQPLSGQPLVKAVPLRRARCTKTLAARLPATFCAALATTLPVAMSCQVTSDVP